MALADGRRTECAARDFWNYQRRCIPLPLWERTQNLALSEAHAELSA